MTNELSAIDTKYGAGHGTYTTYVIGFVTSIVLTLLAYFLVVNQVFVDSALVIAIVGLGLLQLLVQLVCFLHLNTSSRARWNLTAITFTAFIVLFLVGGTLWIMANLNYNMSSTMMDQNVTPQTLGD